MRRMILAAASALALASPAAAQNLQGDTSAWRADPHIRTFYEAVRQACAQGCAKADLPALQARSRVIFGDMAKAHGMKPDAMQDHLAAIPAQMVKLGSEEPKTLESYDAFVLALFGPP